MQNIDCSLPESFLLDMRELLGGEFEAFLNSYRELPRRGLRFNLLKVNRPVESNCPVSTGGLTPIPWCAEGYEYPPDTRPSKSLLYNAGLFYIQEPSAMCPAAVLRPQPGQRVLDLCAAPGGKSVQLAGYMQGDGLLISNDASPSRSRALVKNLELSGVTNAVVTTEMPHRLVERFGAFFDCILVDAPCSGEGMFRRDPDAARAYTANKPEACGALQQEIMHHAARMLKPGGRLVYSTCTFNMLENEGTVAAFLDAHPDFELLPIDHEGLGVFPGGSIGLDKGIPGQARDDSLPVSHFSCKFIDGLSKTARIWPHKAPGEGHFIALMAKKGSDEASIKSNMPGTGKPPAEFALFCKEALNIHAFADETPPNIINGDFHLSNPDKSAIQRLYLQPEAIDLSGLRVARSGWLLGECSKGRFTPSQALAMGITKGQARYAIELPEAEALRFLKGESLTTPNDSNLPPGKPWVLICYSGYPLGWARLVQGRLKNQLPTSWVNT